MSQRRPVTHMTENSLQVSIKSITLEIKLKVLKRLEAGENQTYVANSSCLPSSAIRTIMKNKVKKTTSVMTTSSLSAMKVAGSMEICSLYCWTT